MGYANRETAKPDDYWHAYQGKTYTLPSWDSVKNDYVQVRHNTEMSSMGFQAMSNRREILKQDEETTWFMLGQLAGK